ncbi:potassium large conductance calcium-activated channel subfamily M alpha member 1 [Paragonimus westermani]|uniref:Potassium large conductance calcium-activated channel subfamily M alpha member 1 n=1 Tax=Paragonimus westermani TaxID=34504 RepID=A0A5J4P0X3_9TREM|nr:potassium large conductance calcium-activated channel subfamily M alpha member 1 [Paragonimus westermani]
MSSTVQTSSSLSYVAKDCAKSGAPWWMPILLTAIIICGAVALKVFNYIMPLIIRRRRYRRNHQQSNTKTQARLQSSHKTTDVERAQRWSGHSVDDMPEPSSEEESNEDFIEFAVQKKCTVSHSTTNNRFSVRTVPEKCTGDHAQQSTHFQRLSSIKRGAGANQWNSALLVNSKKSSMAHIMKRDDSLYTENERRYGRLKEWFRRTCIGLSTRQKLTIKLYCERYTTVSYPAGIIMFTVYSVLCTFSWLFYIIGTVDQPPFSAEGICYSLKMRILAWLDFPINIFCLGYYVLRCLAATDRVRFVLSYASIIDLMAIPSSLFAPFESHRHLDFNFIRATCIFNYVDVLTYLGMIKSNQSIQSARICFALFTMWMVGSGLVHGLENLGDFWVGSPQEVNWSFFEACYFLLVTLATVGYGDYVTRTTLGKLFICIFIPVAMRPASSREVSRSSIVHGLDKLVVLTKLQIKLTTTPLNEDFLIVICNIPIDLALKAILSHFHAWVRYFVGTPNNPRDLTRTKMKDARAAIVLATPNTKHRDAEDGANIMQAISLKAQKKTLRVVLQLHNFRNKCLINNFPRWTYLVNDMVVCMEELKLGLMAYNCLAPGFATLILNLLNIHDNKRSVSKPHTGILLDSRFTYDKWNMILVALRCVDPAKIVINPSDLNFVINVNKMRAIVIARDYSEALQLRCYCTACMAHTVLQPCNCRKPQTDKRQKVTIERDLALYEQIGYTRRMELNSDGVGDDTSSSYQDSSSQPPSFRHSITVTSPLTIGGKVVHGISNLRAGTMNNARSHASNPRAEYHKANSVELRNGASIGCITNEFRTPNRRHSEGYPLDRTGSFHWVSDIPLAKAILGDPCSFTDLYAVQLCSSRACVILGGAEEEADSISTDLCLQDRKTLLCAMNIRSLLQRDLHLVHLTTELCYEKNAHLFSSVDTQKNDYKLPVWFNEPFARGLIFSNSLLYSCLNSLFYNDDVFHFLRVLISGQSADEIEALFAVGAGLQPALPEQTHRMVGVVVELRSFQQPPFSFMAKEQRRKPLTFGEVFTRCLTCWQLLCLGLYRLEPRGFRYVLANPKPSTILYAQDMIYCFLTIGQKDTPEAWRFPNTHLAINKKSAIASA